MLKRLFHIYNFFLLVIYLYPGSIIGYILFKDFNKQPQITSDFMSLSSNHLYIFIILSVLGILSYKHSTKIVIYLISISLFLELLHIIIPNRSFEFGDLFGNLIGVTITLILLTIYKIWRKK